MNNFRVNFCLKDTHDLEEQEFFQEEKYALMRAINLIQDGHPEVELRRIVDNRLILEYQSTVIHPGAESLRPVGSHRKKRADA